MVYIDPLFCVDTRNPNKQEYLLRVVDVDTDQTIYLPLDGKEPPKTDERLIEMVLEMAKAQKGSLYKIVKKIPESADRLRLSVGDKRFTWQRLHRIWQKCGFDVGELVD